MFPLLTSAIPANAAAGVPTEGYETEKGRTGVAPRQAAAALGSGVRDSSFAFMSGGPAEKEEVTDVKPKRPDSGRPSRVAPGPAARAKKGALVPDAS